MGLLPQFGLLLVAVVLLVPAALAQCNVDESTNPCVDDCSICAETGGDKVPDPDNCRAYYVCIDNAEHYDLSFDCPDGEVFVFNETVQDCVKGDSCEPCDTTPSPECKYECPEPLPADPVNIPASTDCHNYYVCNADGTMTPMTCDATVPFFDGALCQTDETHCCHCHAFCSSTETATFIADPLDCRRYYLCTTPGEIPTISGTCAEGENFDSFLQGCSATAACDTQCTNVLGADGCIEPFTCLTTGYFARCPGQCTPDYYYCKAATGEYQDAESCAEGTFFDPETHTCVAEDNCPYA